MKKHWLYYFSPCIIGMVISLIAIIAGFADMQKSGGWSYILVYLFGPAFLILLVADVLIKIITKGKVLYIWITELILIAIMIIWYGNI
jgi:hypothetical protein